MELTGEVCSPYSISATALLYAAARTLQLPYGMLLRKLYCFPTVCCYAISATALRQAAGPSPLLAYYMLLCPCYTTPSIPRRITLHTAHASFPRSATPHTDLACKRETRRSGQKATWGQASWCRR
eukprot:1580255-Rhodomonas_salina.1